MAIKEKSLTETLFLQLEKMVGMSSVQLIDLIESVSLRHSTIFITNAHESNIVTCFLGYVAVLGRNDETRHDNTREASRAQIVTHRHSCFELFKTIFKDINCKVTVKLVNDPDHPSDEWDSPTWNVN
jgi:hypothetical protein